MRKRVLFTTALLLALHLISIPAIAGWQSDVTENQNRALWYINELRISPTNLVRPKLIPVQAPQGARANEEMEGAMDRAERLAKSGRADLIEMPVFQYSTITEDRKN